MARQRWHDRQGHLPATGMKHVLLVDEDRPFRERLARAFRARQLEVTEAGSPAEARLQLATASLDGIVLDLWMPQMPGLEFIHELRTAHPTLPIVVLTGFACITTAIEAVRLGVTDYLAKPADVDSVLAALRRRLPARGGAAGPTFPAIATLDRVEWEHIQRVLAETGGNISQSARLLGLDRRSLQRKLGKHPPRQ